MKYVLYSKGPDGSLVEVLPSERMDNRHSNRTALEFARMCNLSEVEWQHDDGRRYLIRRATNGGER